MPCLHTTLFHVYSRPALLATGLLTVRLNLLAVEADVLSYAASAEGVGWPGTTGEKSGAAVQAACAARRWLARSAARITGIRSDSAYSALDCASLVSCLPALERVKLTLHGSLVVDELGCLLNVLAWCPLRELDLYIGDLKEDAEVDFENYPPQPFPAAPAFAKLRSLTKLALSFDEDGLYVLAAVVGALVSITGLAELTVTFPQDAVVPTALGQLTSLQALRFSRMDHCVLEAGCLDLPRLESLEFSQCEVLDAEVLLGVTALHNLTSIILADGDYGPPFVPQLLQLPRLKRAVFSTYAPYPGSVRLEPARLPADLGQLSMALTHLNLKGLGLPQFPLALTQLAALECLQASWNEFAELPAGITALSRLTELRLGRLPSSKDPLQLHVKRPFDARALGELSCFPALRELSFALCEIVLCESLLGAVRHASLASLTLWAAHPAPECALALLQLCQVLRRLRRGRVLRWWKDGVVAGKPFEPFLQEAQGRAPFQQFMAAMEACGL